MTIPPIASEAAASSCPDWMTDDYLRRHLLDLHAGPIAAEVLRLRATLAAIDPSWQAAQFVREARAMLAAVNRDEVAVPQPKFADKFGMHAEIRLARERFDRLRKENETLRCEEKRAGDIFSHVHRCLASVDDGRWTGQPPHDIGSRVGAATAELLTLRKESKRQRAEKAEALLAEVARILGGTGDVVQRARTVTSKLRTTEADREGMLQNLAGISTIACAESLEHYVPGCSWERAALGDVVKLVRKLHDAKAEVERVQAERTKEVGRLSHDLTMARADRNEFAARQVEGFLDWARKPGSPWSGELRDAARARAAQLRLGDVRDAIAAVDLQFAADVKQALGVEPVVAPTEERVLFACSKCSPQNAKSIEDQINRVVSKRVEAERAKPLTGSWCGTGQQEMPPMRRDATPQCPSTEALADIAFCRRDPTLQESRHMAGDLLDRRTGRTPQRFSLGTKFHNAMRRACRRGSGLSSGPIGFHALAEAVEALGAAVEAELSGRP